MIVRHGVLALLVAGALVNQASAQFFGPFGMGGYGGYPFGGYGSYGGYPGMGYGGYPGMGYGYGGFMMPTVWQTSPIVAYTTARTVTRPIVPPNSPVWLDPNYDSWARQNGYYLRPGERVPRYRNSLYPATPVDASELPTPRELNR